jgi:CO/xanthine dehydrogenase FAD-binding subunit
MVFYPASFAELFSQWNRQSNALLFAGGTEIMRRESTLAQGADAVLSLEGISEMRRINRTERYLEIGGTVKLGRITELGKFVPEVLVQCLQNIAGPKLRNMATIGGNICCNLDSIPVLAALDAQYELRGAQSARWVSASRFLPGTGGSFGERELLSRLRVPMENWDYFSYKKFSDKPVAGRSAVFLARQQRNILCDIRMICKTPGGMWRDKDSEMMLAGKRLPLSVRTVTGFVSRLESFLGEGKDIDSLCVQEFAGFAKANLDSLTGWGVFPL